VRMLENEAQEVLGSHIGCRTFGLAW
jgi:hypothetical protein